VSSPCPGLRGRHAAAFIARDPLLIASNVCASGKNTIKESKANDKECEMDTVYQPPATCRWQYGFRQSPSCARLFCSSSLHLYQQQEMTKR